MVKGATKTIQIGSAVERFAVAALRRHIIGRTIQFAFRQFIGTIDSPGNDTFVGGTSYSYMYIPGSTTPFAEFDAAYAFALVYGQSFVGGMDIAINNDPTHNILVGFTLE